MSASLNQIQSDLGLSGAQAGSLMSAFVLPYVIFSLILAGWADIGPKIRLLKYSSLIWSLSALIASFSRGFSHLFLARSFLGVGESAFASISPGVVHHLTQKEKQGRVMATFSAALPLGMALGFVGGGYFTDHFGWRLSFISLSVPAVILSLILFKVNIPNLNSNRNLNIKDIFCKAYYILKKKEYLFATLGFSAYLFVAGGVTHWMPTYIQRQHGLSMSESNMIFGGVAIFSGLLGTFVGGYWGDLIDKKRTNGHLTVCAVSMFLALLPFIWTFFARSTLELIAAIFISQFIFFLSNSNINVVVLRSVSLSESSLAMGLLIFLGHILGDAISSPLIGWVSDVSGELRFGMLICAPVVLLSGILWLMPLMDRKKVETI